MRTVRTPAESFHLNWETCMIPGKKKRNGSRFSAHRIFVWDLMKRKPGLRPRGPPVRTCVESPAPSCRRTAGRQIDIRTRSASANDSWPVVHSSAFDFRPRHEPAIPKPEPQDQVSSSAIVSLFSPVQKHQLFIFKPFHPGFIHAQ